MKLIRKILALVLAISLTLPTASNVNAYYSPHMWHGVTYPTTPTCTHQNVDDKYTSSKYTGNYSNTQHEVKHYYNRTCLNCSTVIKQVSTTEWKNHTKKNNKCVCGYQYPVTTTEKPKTENKETVKTETPKQEYLYGKITNLRPNNKNGIIIGYDIKRDYELKIECSSSVQKAYVQFLNPRKAKKVMAGEQFNVDLKTGTAIIRKEAICTYDCYLYLVGSHGNVERLYQGEITFVDVNRDIIGLNLVLGVKDAFMDNLGGIAEIAKISVQSNWQGLKNGFYKITGQTEKVQTTKAQEMFNFATKVIIPGSEENKIFDQLIQQTFGDILYEILNSSTEEQQRRVGYLLGEVLIGIILSKGIGKVADTIADSSKGVKYAISVSDDLLEMEYVDDIATYSAKMLSTKTDDVVKITDDTIDLFKNSGVTLESIRANKHNLIDKSVDEIADMLKKEGYVVTIKESTHRTSLAKVIEVSNTSKERNISQILVSPGSKRHGDVPYVKISTTNQGRIKVIEGTSATYKTDGAEKAILIFTGEN